MNMGYRLTLLLALLAAALGVVTDLVAATAQSGKGKKTVWIISGQSNACGRGKLPGLEKDPLVEVFDGKARQWAAAQDPLPGMNSEGVGPWQAAGVEVAGVSGMQVRLTGFASGGQPISIWAPGAVGYNALMPIIQKNGKGADVFLWYQGESDANKKTPPEEYRTKLKELVAAVRSAAGNPKMTVVVVQLAHWTQGGGAEFMGIREAQRQFVLQDSHAIRVPALGCAAGDYVHLARDGYLQLGKEIGRALLKTQYGAADVDWPGPVMDKAMLLADGKTVVAHFAEVAKLAGATAGDFGVIPAGGTADKQLLAEKAEAGGTLVTLQFSAPIVLPARLVYGVGGNPKATLADEAGNAAPAVQLDLTPGAAPADVPSAAPNGAGGAGTKAGAGGNAAKVP